MKKSNLRLFSTILLSGIAVVLSYLINFFLSRYVTEVMGVDAYGFVGMAKTFVGYAQVITIVLTSFVVRYITIKFHENDIEQANQYYSSSIAACVVLSIALIVILIPLIVFLEKFINIPSNLVVQVKILFVLVFSNFLIVTITTPFTAFAYIKDKLNIVGLFKIISYLVDAVVMILMFINMTPLLWYVGVGSVVSSTVLFIVSVILTKKYTPELKYKKSDVSMGKIKDITSKGMWNSLNSLGNELNSGLDILITNLLLNNIIMGQISLVKTIGTMFSILGATVSQAFQPRLLKAYSTGDKDIFLKEMSKSMKICGFFTGLAFAGFFALGKTYMHLWVPSQDSQFMYAIALLTIANYVTDGILRPVYYINTLTLKNKIPCFVTIGGGLLNVLSMYLLLKFTSLGAYAVVGTTAVIMIGINLIFNPIYAAKCIDVKSGFFYKIIFRYLFVVAVMCLAFKGIALLFNPAGWIKLIVAALVMVVIGAIIYSLLINSVKENKNFFNKIKLKLFKKQE